MLTYDQCSGIFRLESAILGIGYSGHGVGYNNPEYQHVRLVGPIPAGGWSIVRPAIEHPKLGPICFRLVPAPLTLTFGRNGFWVHGDNFACDHSASEGCIVADHPTRLQLEAISESDLIVVGPRPYVAAP